MHCLLLHTPPPPPPLSFSLGYDRMNHCRIDSLSVLPASFGSQDASKILSLCPSVQLALKVDIYAVTNCSHA